MVPKKKPLKAQVTARERLIDAAYDLFAEHGVSQVGIDTILAKSGCAKASLYNNFNSKAELAVAFLDRREAVWTRGWLFTEVYRRAQSPRARLLVVFDVFDEWFHRRGFEGCSFINVLLESDATGPVHRAAAIRIRRVRAPLRDLARDAGLADPVQFAHTWQMIMMGAIVSACEGDRNAARKAKPAARLVLDGWRRSRRSVTH
jgi:AcrR family transcriptional regulator